MAEAGNRNDGAVPVNLPGGIHVVRPLVRVFSRVFTFSRLQDGRSNMCFDVGELRRW